MKLINTARQTGKTHKIIEEIKKNPRALMITFCEREADRIIQENYELDGRVISLQRYKSGEMDYRGIKEIYIDNIDLCLGIHHRIGIMTMTNYPVKGEYDL